MAVLLASELTDADVAVLTRVEGPALRAGGLRLLALASGIHAGPVVARARAVRTTGRPHDGPGVSPDSSGILHAS
jgi:hypothetical protein